MTINEEGIVKIFNRSYYVLCCCCHINIVFNYLDVFGLRRSAHGFQITL